jgi:NTP pyrophosphatase (non-canonical NTP hydrolase)
MDLDEYQNRANLTDQRPLTGEGDQDDALVFPLMGLASELGSLVTQYKKRIRDRDAHALFSTRVEEELGDIMWYVANVASKLDLSLDSIAALNLKRTSERWPGPEESVPPKLLDDDFPANEQLPRTADVLFEEVDVSGQSKLRLTSAGTQLGNDLTDMNYDDDGYRFHDVFHLSYAAVLGWSPVTRALFGVKRASNPTVREVEDGGRGVVIEEAVAALVFDYARQENFLAGVGQLDSELLRTIESMVTHLEVRTRTIAEWEKAILASFDVWRQMRAHSGGMVSFDLRARIISYGTSG